MAKDLIQVAVEPKVPLKELSTYDDSKDSNNPITRDENVASQKETRGTRYPFVKINGVTLEDPDQVIIDETGPVPKIKVVYTDTNGTLSGPNYPKNDPILSVFINSSNNNFKPIRCDFLITSIKTSRDPLSNIAFGIDFIITGELFIPKLHHNISKSYSDLSSKEVLQALAEESDLGFATNEFTTNDKMTWINTNKSRLKFIQEVVSHSYIDDDSFFTSFIDKYYHLTVVNIAEQLNPTHEMHTTYLHDAHSAMLNANQRTKDNSDFDLEEATGTIILSNHEMLKSDPNYIFNFSLMGDTGRILKSKGFKRKIFYYDHTLESDKFTNFYVNPVKIKGYESRDDAGLEPIDESLKNTEVKKWMGIHYGNTHPEWNAAVLINDHNNSELNKVKLKARTPGINYAIFRGSGISVLLYVPGTDKVLQDTYRDDINNNPNDTDPEYSASMESLVPDEVMSGRYYVSGVKYIYDKDNEYNDFVTEFYLTKVNWYSENNILE